MAQITIDIPPQYMTEVNEAFAAKFSIPQILNPEYDVDNPSTGDEYIDEYGPKIWVKRQIIEFIKRVSGYPQRQEARAIYRVIRDPALEIKRQTIENISFPPDFAT